MFVLFSHSSSQFTYYSCIGVSSEILQNKRIAASSGEFPSPRKKLSNHARSFERVLWFYDVIKESSLTRPLDM